MRRLIFTISLLLLCTNIFFGLFLTGYPTFNVCVNCGVIMISSALLFVLERLKLKDAFRISLSAVILIFAAIQFTLGLMSLPSFLDNWLLITMVMMTIFEIVLLIVLKYISRTV